MCAVLGLSGKVLVSEDIRSCLSPGWTEPIPDGSETRPCLAKVEPISNTGDITVKTYLRKGKECCAAAVRERSEKNLRETGFFPCEVVLIQVAQITLWEL